MKANAPEKLYVDTEDRLSDSILYGFTEKRKEDDIEYVRTDAFVDKAAEWLMESVEKHISADGEYTVYYEEMFEDFKKAMKL